MAKIGLTNFRYGILTEAADGTPSYSGAKTPGAAISCNVEVTNNDAKLYANDGVQESDTSFAGGNVTMGVDRADYQTQADLLGHTYDEEDGLVRSTNDVAPYVGLGRIVTQMINNVISYRVEFLYKVKFAEPSQSDTTKGETVEFNTVEMQGQIAQLANGNWSTAQDFTTKDAATTFLETLLGGAPVSV